MTRRQLLASVAGCAVPLSPASPPQPWLTVSMRDEFGEYPSCKDAMQSFVARVVIRSISYGQRVKFDFQETRLPPHGFLYGLFHASAVAAIKSGMNPYKQLRVVNADGVVKGTFELVLDGVTA